VFRLDVERVEVPPVTVADLSSGGLRLGLWPRNVKGSSVGSVEVCRLLGAGRRRDQLPVIWCS
jgi:hypothetical protein